MVVMGQSNILYNALGTCLLCVYSHTSAPNSARVPYPIITYYPWIVRYYQHANFSVDKFWALKWEYAVHGEQTNSHITLMIPRHRVSPTMLQTIIINEGNLWFFKKNINWMNM